MLFLLMPLNGFFTNYKEVYFSEKSVHELKIKWEAFFKTFLRLFSKITSCYVNVGWLCGYHFVAFSSIQNDNGRRGEGNDIK